jgi:hypothetical protein
MIAAEAADALRHALRGMRVFARRQA